MTLHGTWNAAEIRELILPVPEGFPLPTSRACADESWITVVGSKYLVSSFTGGKLGALILVAHAWDLMERTSDRILSRYHTHVGQLCLSVAAAP